MNISATGKKLSTLLLALFVCLLIPAIGSAGVATEVPVNKSVLLNLQKPSERVSIANPGIAELVVISPTQLQINGTRIGTTSLIVWEKGGKTSFFDIRVKGDSSLLENQIREVAPNDSITVDYAHDTIVLAGKAANEQTVEKVVQIARAYAAKETGNSGQGDKPSPPVQKPYDTRQASYKKGDVKGSTDKKGLNNTQESPYKKDANDSKVKVLNHILIDNPQQVLLEVRVAQVDKTALKSLGISTLVKGKSGAGFSNLVGAPDLPMKLGDHNIDPPGIAGNVPWLGALGPLAPFQLGGEIYKTGLGGVLRALVTKNLAKILAEPNLLVKSGQEGDFLAGKKYYFQIVTNDRASLEEIRVGVQLTFTPVVMENGLISLKIDPAEVSGVSGYIAGTAGSQLPIVDTREIRSEVQLRDGESLVLGGLLQEETVKAMSKIPLLGDIPILGALFRQTQDELTEKELVFFITPNIVKPYAPGQEVVLPTDEPLTPEQEKEFRWIPLTD